jgi:hypothetical protein
LSSLCTLYVLEDAVGGRGMVSNQKSLNKKCFDNMDNVYRFRSLCPTKLYACLEAEQINVPRPHKFETFESRKCRAHHFNMKRNV